MTGARATHGPDPGAAIERIVARASRLTVEEAESLSLYVRDERRRDLGLTSGRGLGWAEAVRELEATTAALDRPSEAADVEAFVRAELREARRSIGNASRDDVVLAAVRAAQASGLRPVLEHDVANALERPWVTAVELGRLHPERPVPPEPNDLPWWLRVGLELPGGCSGCLLVAGVAALGSALTVALAGAVARDLVGAGARDAAGRTGIMGR
jgi:hypothetical protein